MIHPSRHWRRNSEAVSYWESSFHLLGKNFNATAVVVVVVALLVDVLDRLNFARRVASKRCSVVVLVVVVIRRLVLFRGIDLDGGDELVGEGEVTRALDS